MEAGAGRQSFPRERRLTRAAEFLRVKNEGQVQRGSLLLLGVVEAAEGTTWRAGFVTSKRVGNAVVRNQLRRRLREIVRLHQAGLRASVWQVIIARPAAARASYRELEHEWLRLAKRASILRP